MRPNPIGGVVMLILLNLSIIIVLMTVIQKEVNKKIALTIGFGLIFFWPFFTTSLYGFNPFPLVALSIILLLLLIKNKYELALIPILLSLNTELAGAVAFLIFYICVGLIFLVKRKIDMKKYLIFTFGIPAIGVIKILFDYLRQPKVTSNSGLKVLAGTNFKQIALEFIKMIGQVSVPQNVYLGFLFIVIVTIIYLKQKQKNKFIKKFTYLTF